MEKERGKQSVCGQEALDLLNCVSQSPYDEDKCVRLLRSLRECVISKKVKKFLLDDQHLLEANSVLKKA